MNDKGKYRLYPPGYKLLRVLILWLIHRQPLHGYGIAKEMEHLPTGPWKPRTGAVYTILRRMDEEGLLSSEWEKRQGKKDRRIYQVTKKGEGILKQGLTLLKRRMKLFKEMVAYYDTYLTKNADTHQHRQ